MRYSEAGQAALHTGLFDGVPYDAEVWSSVPYLITGAPGRCVEMCRVVTTRAVGSHTYAQACMVVALTVTGAHDEAVAASAGLIDAARATDNPAVASWALLSFGYAHRDYQAAAAYDAFQRGLKIARDAGNRQVESSLADSLARLAAKQGDPMNAFDLLTAAIRNYHDSGGFSLMPSPLAILAALFDRLGRHEPAATISGFAITPLTQNAFPEINTTVAHLREVLGDETYESLARKGVTMTNAAMAQYAFDQIDRARAELSGVS